MSKKEKIEERPLPPSASGAASREEIRAQWERNRCSSKTREELMAEMRQDFPNSDDSSS
jgi:hypothetical protein